MTEISTEKKQSLAKQDLLFSRLFVTSLFGAIALSLYIYGLINLPGLILIAAGAFWNFFVDINTLAAFLLSVLVGLIYSFFSIIEGFYFNAILYTFFYVPLQFVVWMKYMNIKDISIKRYRKLNSEQAYYTFVALCFAFAICFGLTYIMDYESLPALDVLSACLLGLSACLQSLMLREYYYVRPVAVLSVLLLWVYSAFQNGVTLGSVAIIVLYMMYFVLDVNAMNLWSNIEFPVYETKKVKRVLNNEEMQDKLEEYNAQKAEEDDHFDDIIA